MISSSRSHDRTLLIVSDTRDIPAAAEQGAALPWQPPSTLKVASRPDLESELALDCGYSVREQAKAHSPRTSAGPSVRLPAASVSQLGLEVQAGGRVVSVLCFYQRQTDQRFRGIWGMGQRMRSCRDQFAAGYEHHELLNSTRGYRWIHVWASSFAQVPKFVAVLLEGSI